MATVLRQEPTPQQLPTNSVNPPVPRQGCMFLLDENLGAIAARFDYATTLVGFAARMKDHDDELLVLHILDTVAADLSVIAINFQVMLEPAVRACSKDQATVTEKQKISEIYDDPSALLTSLVKKIRSSNQP